MGIGLGVGRRPSSWPQVLAATVLVLAPIAFVALLLFGGGQVTTCLGLHGCPGVQGSVPGPIPIIGTQTGAMVVLVAVGALWLVAAGLTIRYLWSTDRA